MKGCSIWASFFLLIGVENYFFKGCILGCWVLRVFSLFLHVNDFVMDKKLTLSLDTSIIERAKEYAKSHNISISKLIESYLKSLTAQKKESEEVTPLVKSISGVVSIDENFDFKSDYTNFLVEKYK